MANSILNYVTKESLSQVILEEIINTSDNVTFVSETGVLRGIVEANATVGQYANQNALILESHLLPSTASGRYLDNIALDRGIAPRFQAENSIAYITVVANVGTTYIAATNIFKTNSGLSFQLESDFTIGSLGYAIVKVFCTTTGASTNVAPLQITQVTPAPTGHRLVLNEFQATLGSDLESDEKFRQRILASGDILGVSTLGHLKSLLQSVNNSVLDVKYLGKDSNGKSVFMVIPTNYQNFISGDLAVMQTKANEYLSLCDSIPEYATGTSVILVDASYTLISLQFRCELENILLADETRIEIQRRLSRFLDYNNFKTGKQVRREDVFEIITTTPNVKIVKFESILLNNNTLDITPDKGTLPVFAAFQMFNLNGTLIIDNAQILNPFIYENEINLNYIRTALNA